jgi:hypothetical protein
MKKTGLAAVIAIAIFGTSIIFSPIVLATSCTPTSHCYGVAIWTNSPSNTGNYVYIDSICLSGPNDNTNFADEELWEGTNNSTNLAYWVETGLSYGEINGVPEGGPYWFWADNRPNGGGYHEHYYAKAANNVSYLLEIFYISNNQWYVYDNNVHVGTSSSNPPGSRSMETGEEFTNSTYSIKGSSSDMSWFDASGGNHFQWTYGGSSSYVYYTPSSAAYAYWNSTYNDVEYKANCGVAPAAPGTRNPSARLVPVRPDQIKAEPTTLVTKGLSPVPTSAANTLVAMSRTMVASAGGTNVTQSEAVLTTRQQANTVASGAAVSSDQPVYLVQVQGLFTALLARVPKGHAPPSGQYLTFTVDAASGALLDWGVSGNKANLFTLGPVTGLSQ